MSMFNMGGVKDTKVTTNKFLSAGIHKVIFKGLDKAENYNAIEFRFEAVDGSGNHNERIFEPRSAERSESQYGPNPSEAEQFMCKIKQIINALDPELGKRIETEGEKFAAPTFDGFIALLKKHLTKSVGVETYIKLIPTSGTFVGFPGFIARINKDGNLYMNNKVIGEDLVLTAKETQLIKERAEAKPTVMKQVDDELADLKDDFPVDSTDDDELPF